MSKTDTGRKPVRKPAGKPAKRRKAGITPEKVLKCVKALLPHLCIIMCGMFLVFFVIDRVNTHQGFMTNEFHKWLIFFLSLACAVESIIMVGVNRKNARLEEKRRRQLAAKKGQK